jgi:hypothetical protein
MKKMLLIIIIIVTILVISILATGYYWNSLNSKQKDASWVGTINQMLENYSSYPNSTEQNNPNVLASYCRVYLFENKTSDLVEFGDLNSNQMLSVYLNNLLTKVNTQINTISADSLNKTLTNDKVVEIIYRGATHQFGGQQKFQVGYFILSDDLNEGLTGTVITQEVGSQSLSVWEIAK